MQGLVGNEKAAVNCFRAAVIWWLSGRLFDALQLRQHRAVNALQVAVVADILLNDCAALLAPVLDECAIDRVHDRSPAAPVALDQAVRTSHSLDARCDLLFMAGFGWRDDAKGHYRNFLDFL